MIRFCAPRDAAALAAGGDWIHLGKDPRSRAALEAALGRPPLPLGDRLHEQARRLRRPFLDLVARLGRARADAEAWWAGILAWKDPGVSDLFLLLCFRAVALRLASEPAAAGTTVVVEDPWLLAALAGQLSGRARFGPPPRLVLVKAAAAALGAVRRLAWAARTMTSRARLAALGVRRAPGPPGSVAIHSYMLDRSFAEDGSWRDHYLPGLAEELTAAGRTVVRFVDPDCGGREARLAAAPGVSPLLLEATAGDLLRALCAPPASAAAPAEFDGGDVSLLFERERWADAARAGRCAYLLFSSCARRFLARTRCSTVVYPWENQPQERMLALAAAELGVRTVGVQHSTLPSLQLSYFSGAGETAWAPLPKTLIVSGERPLADLLADGWPRERLVLGGSRRFAAPAAPAPAPPPPRSGEVLLLLPIDPVHAGHLLAAAARAAGRFRFAVKTHPASPIPPPEWGFAARAAPGSMTEAVAACADVVFTGSTAGLEAMLAGRPALRYRPDAVLDIDPCDFLTEADLPTAGDADFAGALDRLSGATRPPEAVVRALPSLFAPVDRRAWDAALAPDAASEGGQFL